MLSRLSNLNLQRTIPKNIRTIATAADLKCFKVNVLQNGVAMITIDCPNAPVNSLTAELQDDLPALLSIIEGDDSIKACVLRSDKKNNFVAGADINQLAALTSAEDGAKISAEGQIMMNKVENLKKPIVAAINGSALGGGAELAMACHYRIASSNPKTILGFPEVQLGLLPGAGGTQRLPKLVGIQQALTMATTGQNLKADRAKRAGLVDQVADPHALDNAAIQAALGLADGTLKRKPKKKNMMARALEDNPLGRNVLFKKAGEMAEKKTGGKYPAIPLIMEAIRTGVESGMEAGHAKEAENFGILTQSSESKALMGIGFNGMMKLKKNPYNKPKKPVETFGVLGAGLMGAGIAQVTAKKGTRTLLKDMKPEFVARGLSQIKGNLDKTVKRRKMSGFDRDLVMSNIVGLDDDGNWKKHFETCDLVIEAVLEDMNVKHTVLKQMEDLLPGDAIFATNTSGLKVADIASVSKRPENVVGMHYFSPVDKMPLLEIIKTDKTSDETLARAYDLGLRQGKTIIVTKDVAGFYVNRCLGPYLVEVMACIAEGAFDDVDKAMVKFGFPMGPLTLGDMVGIDVAAKIVPNLAGELGARVGGATTGPFDDLLEKGLLGQKTKKGFFTYDDKLKKGSINPEALEIVKKYVKNTEGKPSVEEIGERCSSRFALEAAICVQDGVVESPMHADVGAVFGCGFPPFLGGPLRMIDSIGIKEFNDRLRNYQNLYGDQWELPQILLDMEKNGTKFYND
jgi:enoyl-CoA hydratase/long-chain 3-hydroxyacyl-CoA dehydrogenase